MRNIVMACLLLGGCATTPQPALVPEVVDLTPLADTLTEEDVYLKTIEEMIAERNRLQRQLYSISTYKLDLPVDLRAAIHCGDVGPRIISIPTADYLKVAHSVISNPKQMEDLLIGYIKTLISVINAENIDAIDAENLRLACYDKFKLDE